MIFICRNSNFSRADRNIKNLLTAVGDMHKICGNKEEEATERICTGYDKFSKTLNSILNCSSILVICKIRHCDREIWWKFGTVLILPRISLWVLIDSLRVFLAQPHNDSSCSADSKIQDLIGRVSHLYLFGR